MTHTDKLVQKAWTELCCCIQPGGRDGMSLLGAAIEAGPPVQPSAAALMQMELASVTEFPAYQETYFDLIVSGGPIPDSPDDRLYRGMVEQHFPDFDAWCTEVFPG